MLSGPRGEQSVFRANPAYKLVLIDRLSEHDRSELQQADGHEDLYGALVPQAGATHEWRSVSCETALLFLTLAEPGPLPRYVLHRLGHDAEHTIKRLLLDGVLQIAIDDEFVCGPQVAELFASAHPCSEHGRNFDLAVAALRYGQELQGLSEAELGQRLYFYGRQPLSPQLSRRLADTAAVATYLGIQGNGALIRALGSRWTRVPTSEHAREFWWQWISTSDPPRGTAQRACYKLYVSPALDHTPTALEVIVGSLGHAQGITGFKVGVGLAGISRPDKILVYFTQLDDLYGYAELLRTRLSGCTAHGVPFTAAASQDGLLSWGADPPAVAPAEPTTSWRMWVARRLAAYLIAAQSAALSTLEPWQYALERLSLAGIDTRKWIPADGMWPVALEAA